MEFSIDNIIRPNIKQLKPYTTARHEYTGTASVYLDANENALGSALTTTHQELAIYNLNRYPDPTQLALKQKLSTIKGVPPHNIYIGNGSDEAIDVLMKLVCEPKQDNVIICPPTYGMYSVCAGIQDVAVQEVPLLHTFELYVQGILQHINAHTKIICICSPNNPTGNTMQVQDVELLLQSFNGIVLLDEAYINYSTYPSLLPLLTQYANLVILQTLSKAWGLAGIRIGMAYASKAIINYMNTIKYPYNISTIAQQLAISALDNLTHINGYTIQIVQERKLMQAHLLQKKYVVNVYPSNANFLLVQFNNAHELYLHLCTQGIIVRDRSSVPMLTQCLRITVGTPSENAQLFTAIEEFYNT